MVGILLATHNSEKYLGELLDSLLSQTYRDIKIMVSDDASSDNTMQILRSYADQNENITVLEGGSLKGGAKENFFELIRHAKEEYVMFADHDDIWQPSKVGDTLHVMREMEKSVGKQTPVLVHTDLTVVDEQLHTIAPSMMRAQKLNPEYTGLNKILSQNNVTGCTVMTNRALIDTVRYTDMKPIVMHDWWLALIASAFGKIAFLSRPTIKYRQHKENQIGAVDAHGVEYMKNSLSDRDNLKKRLEMTYLQAEEFLKTYGDALDEKNEKIVRSYAEFAKINKFSRWVRLFRFNYFKYGFPRKMGQLILG